MTAHDHNHDHEVAQTPDSAHEHVHTHSAAGRTLLLALVLTLGFSVVELVAGWRSGSLALLADAGHMVTDGASLGISALAAWLAARPPSRRCGGAIRTICAYRHHPPDIDQLPMKTVFR